MITWNLLPVLAQSTGLGPVSPPPYAARTELLSISARDRSILSAPRSLPRKAMWISSQVPSARQSRSLRQQVIPHLQLISAGRYSQRMPVLSTNRMPVSVARCPTQQQPPLGPGGGSGGSNGSMISQSSSGSRGLAMVATSRGKVPGYSAAIDILRTASGTS